MEKKSTTPTNLRLDPKELYPSFTLKLMSQDDHDQGDDVAPKTVHFGRGKEFSLFSGFGTSAFGGGTAMSRIRSFS
ncbi:hypothetical protein AVEN_52356-1 [Araneus ventricosus]|uniref:Uncharacterized protein n=1 Tax=Araneus ventricosus TaxID=182803 RepID=A0A4Y2ISQ1_ARAVE|nr:hypothetical protein AVEN_52356-1 [Araneus ventricosus]